MSNSIPRTVRLKAMLALEEKRATLQQEIDAIQHQIATIQHQLFGEESMPIAIPKMIQKAIKKGRAKRGALKAKIMSALESAGNAGVQVTHLASDLGTKAANLHAWFHSTAKRIPSIVKVAGGHYRLNGQVSKAAPVAKAKTRKSGNKKRGGLSENVMAALSSAGSKGITLKDIADQSGTNYRNVAVWFATTGKKNPKIKKLAPATYKLVA
jgi:hypothetical protein